MFILYEITRMYAGSKGEIQYKPKGFHAIFHCTDTRLAKRFHT